MERLAYCCCVVSVTVSVKVSNCSSYGQTVSCCVQCKKTSPSGHFSWSFHLSELMSVDWTRVDHMSACTDDCLITNDNVGSLRNLVGVHAMNHTVTDLIRPFRTSQTTPESATRDDHPCDELGAAFCIVAIIVSRICGQCC